MVRPVRRAPVAFESTGNPAVDRGLASVRRVMEERLPGATADAQKYTPAQPADWTASPTTVTEAIDRIAAIVAAATGSPIP